MPLAYYINVETRGLTEKTKKPRDEIKEQKQK